MAAASHLVTVDTAEEEEEVVTGAAGNPGGATNSDTNPTCSMQASTNVQMLKTLAMASEKICLFINP